MKASEVVAAAAPAISPITVAHESDAEIVKLWVTVPEDAARDARPFPRDERSSRFFAHESVCVDDENDDPAPAPAIVMFPAVQPLNVPVADVPLPVAEVFCAKGVLKSFPVNDVRPAHTANWVPPDMVNAYENVLAPVAGLNK